MPQQPNIFLFVMDTARAANLSAYGYERDTTPFLEECAEEGFIFENAIANSIWTYPSHVSMFTGRYPYEHERVSKDDRGKIMLNSFVEDLEDDGYETIGISNNGFVSHMFGFDSFFKEFKTKVGRKTFLFDKAPLMEEFQRKEAEDYWESDSEKYKDFLKSALESKSVKSLINGAHYILKFKFYKKIEEKFPSIGDDFWKDHGAEKILSDVREMNFDSEKPKFMFANFVEPHGRYTPPRKFAGMFHEGDIDEHRELLDTPSAEFLGEDMGEEAEIYLDFYDASLRYMDHMVEKIHNEIEEKTSRENVYIFLGDHGEMFNSEGLWEHHGGFRKEVLRVPLIVKGVKRGSEDLFFELKQMGELIDAIRNGEEFRLGGEEAFSDYLGLSSHMFKDELPEGFDSPKSAKISSEGLKVVSNLSEADGELKEHLRYLKMIKNRKEF